MASSAQLSGWVSVEGTRAGSAGRYHLFLSETGQPLTKGGITLLFDRLRNRAGIMNQHVTASLLRDTFATRYMQAGGNPQGLQELMGYEGMAPIRQYLRWSDQVLREQAQQEIEEG